MKKFLRKITLEQVKIMRKFFSLRWRKRGEMEEIEGKVDCATRIARHKLTVYKNWFVFSQSIIYAI
jgi:hypothetical protein